MGTLKTDTETTIRVTLTFQKLVDPEWFELLSKIDNGWGRASLVRRYLATPDLARHLGIAAKAPPDDRGTPATEMPKTPSGSTVQQSDISEPTTLNSSTENPLVLPVLGEKQPQNNDKNEVDIRKDVNSSEQAPPRRTGMASNLLNKGRTGS